MKKMASKTFNEPEFEAFEIESARDVVSCSFVVQRSLTPLDLNASEYMLWNRSIFTEDGYRNMCQPNRKILYELHLDQPKDMSISLRIHASNEADRYKTFQHIKTSVSNWVYNRDLAPLIVNNIVLAENKAEKLRRYLNIMKLLKFNESMKTANFIFDNIIRLLYADCDDSNLVVEFAEIFCFFSWLFQVESPDIVGYVLEHARRLRYNIWESSEKALDSINACIIFYTNRNIGKLLEYGTALRFQYFSYMEILGEFLKFRSTTQRRISERRIFFLIQLFYCFAYNFNSWLELRSIWRSIPNPYLSREEMHFAFGRVMSPKYLHVLISYYHFTIEMKYVETDYLVPRSLLDLCRVAVRNNLSRNFQLPHGIEQLYVPKIMKSFLKLEH